MSKYTYCPACASLLVTQDDGYQYCQSETCDYINYGNPVPVVAAIIEYGEDEVLLAHNVAWPPKWYALITGFLERGEHPEEAVLREVKEETNLDGEIGSFIGHYTFSRMNQIIMVYHIIAKGEIKLNDELDDYRLVPFDKVKTWPTGTGRGLKDFLESRGYKVEEVPLSNAK